VKGMVNINETRKSITFEQVWRFLNRYGSIYPQIDEDPVMDVKTGFTKTEKHLTKIIRFTAGEKEVTRICASCWAENVCCDGKPIKPFRDALIEHIENAYIE
jgi:hypothetical protein